MQTGTRAEPFTGWYRSARPANSRSMNVSVGHGACAWYRHADIASVYPGAAGTVTDAPTCAPARPVAIA